jgi:nucleoside phosphorylase
VASAVNVEDLILNYDPEFPQQRFVDAGVAGALKSSTGRLPSTVPWPEASKPTAVPLNPAPLETDDLSRFHGYDAVIVTWTSAEAAALAAMFTPDYLPSLWYEYRYNVAEYVPLVTGAMAPFRDTSAEMARYYHSLGLYFPCTIGKAKVLLFKSGLHLDYDGPAIPVKKLMTELVQTIAPKVFITTGTGGGIGADVALGDVVVAGRVRFDCTTQFKTEPWSAASYKTSALPAGALASITPDLTKINAARIKGARAVPKIWSSAEDTIVTTDFFGFDDSTDYYKLEGNGACACDMGDAMVANALQGFPDVDWYAIRNASDPQMPNPDNKIEEAKQAAGQIYTEYGAFTTAASAIATWAVVDARFNSAAKN